MNANTIAPVSAVELIDAGTSPRADFLSHVISSNSNVLVYGASGVGKTFFALGVAWAAAAGGSFLDWRAPRAHRVVYVDGELGADDMRERLALFGAPPPQLQFFLPDLRTGPLDLTRVDMQQRLMERWGDPELVVLDSLTSLAALRGGDGKRWERLQHFLQRQKNYGRAMLAVHHTNQEGRLHGSAQRANAFDPVIALHRPANWRPSDGACFDIHFEKARRLTRDALEPMRAQLRTDPDGKARWHRASAAGSVLERAVALLNSGSKVKAMGETLGVSLATAYRLRARAHRRGLLSPLT